MRVASVGGAAAAALAADFALSGHEAVLVPWPDDERGLADILAAKSVELAGEPAQTIGGRLGLARPMVGRQLAAIADADIVIAEFEPAAAERRIAELAPHLRNGQVLHANTHGYWPALRAAPILAAAGLSGVTLTESIAPLTTAALRGAVATSLWRRRHLPVAAFPAERSGDALARLAELVPDIVPAQNVLETGLANLNMLVHPGIALVNLASFDRAVEAGATANFYGRGNTASASRLTEALDLERQALCAAFGVRWKPVTSYLRDFYGAEGDDFRTAVRTCRFYAALPEHDPRLGLDWVRTDLPFAHTPLVALARIAGVPTPLQEGLLSIFGAVLDPKPKGPGLGLVGLGLTGLDRRGIIRYVESGARSA